MQLTFTALRLSKLGDGIEYSCDDLARAEVGFKPKVILFSLASLMRLSSCKRARVRCPRLSLTGSFLILLACIPLDSPRVYATTDAIDKARERSLQTLRTEVSQSNAPTQMDAAESLLRLGYLRDIPSELFDETIVHPGESASEVIRRLVLKRAITSSRTTADSVLLKTCQHLIALTPEVRLQAIERLDNRSIPLASPEFQAIAAAIDEEPWQNKLAVSTILAFADGAHIEGAIAPIIELLTHPEPAARIAAARALQRIGRTFSDATCRSVASAAQIETDDEALAALHLTLFSLCHDAFLERKSRSYIESLATSSSPSQRHVFADAMAARGGDSDLVPLLALLDDDASTVRVASANAILRIDRRRDARFRLLDWLVLGTYGLGVIGVGWYYSRSSSVEDYMLGGREMKPWAVGISLFATLMSTLTYLAMPGEIIQHGPMILCGFLSYPLIYLIVSRLIIPFIMRLQVTSAYEILEMRLGLSIRMLGSAIFLTLRLLWMGMIAYATSSVVLVPMLGLDESSTPMVCAVMALCTVAYTSAGGLKAVVVTDVAQMLIMLVGVILSLTLISYALGGVEEWIPRYWEPHWDAPSLLFAKDARVPAGLAILSTFTWYICTAGSDQMAIQRYLATRDAKSASRMFGIALWCDIVVTVLLAALGLSLVAYSSAHPEILPDGETLLSSADQLFPQFIVKVLPAGLSGLVVAGILSAAMDSLSSGLNSSSSVIMTDWVERFRPHKAEGRRAVSEARLISWIIGIVVVFLGVFASMLAGNLLEKCYTIVNLFTASLFVLFFLAMYVPWATTFGTWVGAIVSISIAISMAYGNWFELSFLWITPVSLMTGVVGGCLGSLLPIGVAQPMLRCTETDSRNQ